jgi:hypothetical protein
MTSIRVPVHSTCAPPPPERLALDSKRGSVSVPSFLCTSVVSDKDADSCIRSVCASRGVTCVSDVAAPATVKPLGALILDYTPHAYVLPPSDAAIKEELMTRGPLLFALGATSHFAHFWSEVAEGKISGKGVFTHSVTSRRHSRVWVVAALVGWMPRGWRVVVPWVPSGQMVNLEFGCGAELMAIGMGLSTPEGATKLPLTLPAPRLRGKAKVSADVVKSAREQSAAPQTRRFKIGDVREWAVWNSTTLELAVVWATLVVLCALYLHVVFSRVKK